MKRKQITAILMSAILTVSSCMPMNGISAMAAETAGAGGTEVAAEVEADTAADTKAEETAVDELELEPAVVEEPTQVEEPAATVEPAQPETTETEDDGEPAEGSGDEAASEAAATDEPAVTGEPAEPEAPAAEEPEAQDKEESEEVKAQNEAKKMHSEEFESAVDIAAGESKEVTVEQYSIYYIFRFTPDVSGTYRFYSESDKDTFVVLYDENHNFIVNDGDSGDGNNFSLEREFVKDHTYYFVTQGEYGCDSTYTVHLELVRLDTLSVEGSTKRTVEVTCPVTGPVTLSVEAESVYPITYQWRYYSGNSSVLSETASLEITPTASRYIICEISDGNESETIQFYLALNHFTIDQSTSGAISVECGQELTLTANVTADVEDQIQYKWTKITQVIDGNTSGVSREVVQNGIGLNTLELGTVSENAEYECEVRDQYGNLRTLYYTVTVNNNFKAYVITNGPINVNKTYAELTINTGESVTLKVGVSANDTSGITYRWYDNEYNEIEGADSDTYVVENVQEDEEYRCSVTDRFGSRITCYFRIYAMEVIDYVDVTRNGSEYRWFGAGGSTTLSVSVNSNVMDQLTYAWYYNDEIIPGKTETTLRLDDTAKTGIYTFRASYEDISGEVSFDVTRQNVIELGPKTSPVTISPTGSADLEVVVYYGTDTEGMRYEWYEVEEDPSAPVGPGGVGYSSTLIPGANASIYTILPGTAKSKYQCHVYDRYNNMRTVDFDVVIENHFTAYVAGYSEDTQHLDVDVYPGESVRLEAAAVADDMTGIQYQWLDGHGDPIEGATSAVYEFTPSANGYYTCRVSDKYGNCVDVYFTITIHNEITINPEAYDGNGNKLRTEVTGDNYYTDVTVYAPVGETVILKTNAATTFGSLKYNWTDIYDDLGCADPDYTINEFALPYRYNCSVDDDFGNYAYIAFNVEIDNKLEAHPEGVPDGDTKYIYGELLSEVTLTTIATAGDTEGMTYSWSKVEDGASYSTPISETGNSITERISGNAKYTCRVTDRYGNSKEVYFIVRLENNLVVYPEGADLDGQGRYADTVDLYASAGDELDLHVCVNADDMGYLRYRWAKNVNTATSWGEYQTTTETISGETSNTLHITADKTTTYKCTVSDMISGSKTVMFNVHVSGLIAYPEGADEVDGEPSNRVVVACEAGGVKTLRVITLAPEGEPLTYKWTSGPLNDSGWWPLEPGEDSTTNELTVGLDSARRYLCTVTDSHENQVLVYFYVNAGGVKLSSNKGTPVLVGDNSYEVDVPVTVGESTTLETILETNASGNVRYFWENDNFDTLPGATGNSLTVTGGDGSYYVCNVIDANGVRSRLTFNMSVDNELAVKPAGEPDGTTEKDIVANVGDQINLAVEVAGINLEGLSYKWVNNLGRTIAATAAYSVTVSGSEVYTCRVTDCYGNVKTASIRVLTDSASIADAEITLSQTYYPCDGLEKKPAVSVVLNGKTLVNGKDYVVSYKNNRDPGTASAIVKGKTVAGTKTVNFTIGKMVQKPVASVDVLSVAVGKTLTFNVSGCHTPLTAIGVNAAIATATVSEQTVSVKGVKVGTYELVLSAAENDVYESAAVKSASGNSTIVIKVLPAKTASVTTENANKGIKITWKKVAGATGYVIKRQAGSGEWKTVKTVSGGNVVTYTDAYANTNGTKYTYRVYAKAATGTSNLYVASVCYKVLRPAIKSVTNSASKKMTVKWAKNAKANGYKLQYSLKSNFSGAKTWDSKKNSVISWTQGGLTKGKKYYVRMRTYKKVGSKMYYSTWSPTKTVTIKK